MTSASNNEEEEPLITHSSPNYRGRRLSNRLDTLATQVLFAGLSHNQEFDNPVCPAGLKDNSANKDAKKKLILASILCFAFFIIELVAGIYSGSLAILSDSFHLLSDIAGFIISLAAIYLASQPASKRHSWGYHRAEIIGAILSTFLIWILTGFLVYEAIERIQNPTPINGKVMFGTALAGVFINIILGLTLHEHHGHGSHSHSHERDSQSQEHGESEHDHLHPTASVDIEEGIAPNIRKQSKNINVSSAAIHVIGDLISSIGVLISSIIVLIDPSMTIVDPICTFIFSAFVLLTTVKLMSNSLVVLMEGTPEDLNSDEVIADLLALDGVKNVHDMHIWNLTIGKPALAVHIELVDALPSSNVPLNLHDYSFILSKANLLLCNKYGIHHSTIQIEVSDFGQKSLEEGNSCGHDESDHIIMAHKPHCNLID